MAKQMTEEKFSRIDGKRSEKPASVYLTTDGREIPDPTPLAPSVGFIQQPSMIDNIRNMIRSERLRQEAEAAGYETPEEADDFDVGDDYDPTSPYEHDFDIPGPPHPSGHADTPSLERGPPKGKAAPRATAAEDGGGGEGAPDTDTEPPPEPPKPAPKRGFLRGK